MQNFAEFLNKCLHFRKVFAKIIRFYSGKNSKLCQTAAKIYSTVHQNIFTKMVPLCYKCGLYIDYSLRNFRNILVIFANTRKQIFCENAKSYFHEKTKTKVFVSTIFPIFHLPQRRFALLHSRPFSGESKSCPYSWDLEPPSPFHLPSPHA